MRWQPSGVVVLLLALAVAGVTGRDFAAKWRPDDIYPGPGVTTVRRLSDYHPPLAGTAGDTDVYVLEGDRPGGTVLVLGGVHPDEFAGFLAAVLLVERAQVEQGRLIVIPQANASGFTHNLPGEGHPAHIEIETAGGTRRFRYGARATNPIHQWPDPDVYVQASGQQLSGSETRNLNRAFPGRPDGTLTEQIAYAVMELIRQENVDMGFDLHEASPEYPVINTIVAHPRMMDLAVLVVMDMELAGIPIRLEQSPEQLRGLSHREWGDFSGTLAALFETANPAQGRLRGKTSAQLVLEGKDEQYERAARLGRLYVPFGPDGHPVETRVGRHLATLTAFFDAFGMMNPDRAVVVSGVPTFEELARHGVGAYLQPPAR
ncbi:MAG: succinylglutamate desuccinylase/aspartoacylase family protein [Firmicutes bacterium]|nr:succinylglutamate desuccinylase/aspartoacylase family protein [Bacillota bacterium]